jgi:hypothetical protein
VQQVAVGVEGYADHVAIGVRCVGRDRDVGRVIKVGAIGWREQADHGCQVAGQGLLTSSPMLLLLLQARGVGMLAWRDITNLVS